AVPGNLVVSDPDAAFAFDAFGGDAVFGDGADQHFLEVRDVFADVALAFAEVEDGVADELAGAVIGDVAAARRFEKADTLRAKDVAAGEQMIEFAAAAEGDDRRMYEQEKLVGELLVLTQSYDHMLTESSYLVRDASETEYV